MTQHRTPSALDDFLFDLNGYLILRDTASPELLAGLNAAFDELPRDLPLGGWYKNAQRRDYTPDTGLELHQAYEMGAPFEEMIDHPSWIDYVAHYCGEEKAYTRGLFIDESIASIRTAGGHHPVHSGGFQGALRGAYAYKNGVFRCGQVNIILALTDIGEGDGPTMIIPGSHKSNFPHPGQGDYGKGERMDHLEGAVPAYLNKGDALLFVDGLMHGGSSRTKEGERRIIITRYGPDLGRQSLWLSAHSRTARPIDARTPRHLAAHPAHTDRQPRRAKIGVLNVESQAQWHGVEQIFSALFVKGAQRGTTGVEEFMT